jgi:hypothetical protein
VEGSDDRIAGEYNKKHEYYAGCYAKGDHGPGREYEGVLQGSRYAPIETQDGDFDQGGRYQVIELNRHSNLDRQLKEDLGLRIVKVPRGT